MRGVTFAAVLVASSAAFGRPVPPLPPVPGDFPACVDRLRSHAATQGIRAPVLWLVGAESNIPRWLDGPAVSAGADPLAGVRRRLAHVADGRLEVIADAGHMLQHDQPAAVAAVIEPFLTGRS